VPLPHEDLAAALHALTAAEFIYEQELYPVAVYAFSALAELAHLREETPAKVPIPLIRAS